MPVGAGMTRRHLLHSGALALAGCATSPTPAGAPVPVKAGPFTVDVPAAWAKTAVVRKVPLKPLYTEAEWQAQLKDKSLVLKPSYENRPQHWAVRLPAAVPKGVDHDPKGGGGSEAPEILIHKAAEWAVAFSDGLHAEHPGAAERRRIRKDMETSGRSPAYFDASLDCQCLKKRLNFAGGRGVRFVCQWGIEPDLIRKGRLHYQFVGLSDDDTCQIIATFPLDLPGLPDRDTRTHLGRNVDPYGDFSKGVEAYYEDAEKWLAQHAAKIAPSLPTLDAMISSLVARTWA